VDAVHLGEGVKKFAEEQNWGDGVNWAEKQKKQIAEELRLMEVCCRQDNYMNVMLAIAVDEKRGTWNVEGKNRYS